MADTVGRREFLATFGAFPLIISAFGVPRKRPPMTIYKDPACGCCSKWVDYLKDAGVKTTVKEVADLAPLKKELGVPDSLTSCHTAVMGPYVIEGHVPIDAIDKLLADKPSGARGLAVAGMPIGSPGMEVAGRQADRYDVMLFGNDGKSRVFMSKGSNRSASRGAGPAPNPKSIGRPLHALDRVSDASSYGLQRETE